LYPYGKIKVLEKVEKLYDEAQKDEDLRLATDTYGRRNWRDKNFFFVYTAFHKYNASDEIRKIKIESEKIRKDKEKEQKLGHTIEEQKMYEYLILKNNDARRKVNSDIAQIQDQILTLKKKAELIRKGYEREWNQLISLKKALTNAVKDVEEEVLDQLSELNPESPDFQSRKLALQEKVNEDAKQLIRSDALNQWLKNDENKKYLRNHYNKSEYNKKIITRSDVEEFLEDANSSFLSQKNLEFFEGLYEEDEAYNTDF
jgi:hypothetical protein